MSLQPGVHLGPYEIQWLIGRGGMGEVYRATDTRLHRPVAIKVLPEELTSSATALDRLLREAQTASLLNHPNICTVYDVGVSNPAFIAMELLEGESLHRRLRRGPLDVHSLLEIAIATVDGLEAAHAHRFIHRDIKPANIFLTSHGPKVLDFGLAKVHAGAPADVWTTDDTRLADALVTESGLTVGTVAYMSPEQLHGRDIDARTDLFSFGLVLYEMATGQPAFTGTTSAAIGGAILYEHPTPPIDVARALSPRLNDIILKSIEKDRDDRYQTAADLRTDLRRLRRELDSHGSHATIASSEKSGTTPEVARYPDRVPPAIARTRLRHVRSIASALLVVGALSAVVWYLGSRTSDPPEAPARISIADLQVTRLTATGDAERPAIAPDGNYLAFIRRQPGQESLHVRQTATSATAEIVKAEREVTLWGATVSPDGGFVDYVRRLQLQVFELWRVPFLGGVPRRLMERVNSSIGWSPDGKRFAFVRAELPGTTTVVLANADGSSERTLAQRQRPAQFFSLMIATRPSIAPAWSPDGRTVAVVGAGAGAEAEQGDVAFIDVENGSIQTVPLPSSAVRGLIWFDGDMLLLNAAVPGRPLQLHQLSYPSGNVIPLTRDINDYDGISLAADRRTLVATRRERQTDLAILDMTGRVIANGPNITAAPPTTEAATLRWVADRVLYSNWAWTPGEQPRQVLMDSQDTTGSPDGRTLIFTRSNGLWRADREGGRVTQIISGEAFYPIVTADNRSVIYLSARSGEQSPWMVPIDGGEPRQLTTTFAAAPGVDISPDGRWLVFPSRDAARKQATVMMCELQDCRPKTVLSGQGVTRLRWMPDGRTLAYVDNDARTNLWLMPTAGGPARQLTRFDNRQIIDFDVSSDGTRLVVARRLETNDIVVLKGLRRQ